MKLVVLALGTVLVLGKLALAAEPSSAEKMIDSRPPAGPEAIASNPALELLQVVMKAAEDRGLQNEVDSQLRAVVKKKTNGLALLKTERFFPAELMKRFYLSIDRQSARNVLVDGDELVKTDGDDRSEFPSLTPEQMTPVHEYVVWLTKALNRNLPPDEQVEVAHTEVGVITARKGNLGYGPWHVDPGYIVATIAMYGKGTRFLKTGPHLSEASFATKRKEIETRSDYFDCPQGESLVYTADERAKAFPTVNATIHRAPPPHNRLYLVVRFARKNTVGPRASVLPVPLGALY